MSSKFEKHLQQLIDLWFVQRKTLTKDDYEMLRALVYEKVHK
jgi:hypothetical protein